VRATVIHTATTTAGAANLRVTENTKTTVKPDSGGLLEQLGNAHVWASCIPPAVTLHMYLNADRYFSPAAAAVSASHQSAILTHATPRVAIRPLAAHAGLCPTTTARRAEVLILYGRRGLLREQLPPDERRAKKAADGVDNL